VIPPGAGYTHLLFDLDDTLYIDHRVPDWVRSKIDRFIQRELDIPADQVAERRARLFVEHGTTLSGLIATGHTGIDYDEWHAFIHGTIPYDDWIRPNPPLAAMIRALPQRKYVFTNADLAHAERCLALLGMEDLFEGVVSFDSVMAEAEARGLCRRVARADGSPGPLFPIVCKPQREAFEIALAQCGGPPPGACLFLDDSPRNVAGAKRLGIDTVLVGHAAPVPEADAYIPSLEHLPQVMPGLFESLDPRRLAALELELAPGAMHHSASSPLLAGAPAGAEAGPGRAGRGTVAEGAPADENDLSLAQV